MYRNLHKIKANLLMGLILNLFLGAAVVQAEPLSNWQRRHWDGVPPDPSSTHLNAVAYGNGAFAAVGTPNLIVWSTNGAVWHQHLPPSPFYGQDIVFGNGMFLALGFPSNSYECGHFLNSSNGIFWANAEIRLDPVSPPCVYGLRALAFGAGKFVVVGDSEIMVSTNGRNWSLAVTGLELGLQSVAFGNGVFVAIGLRPSDYQSVILYSFDGLNWDYAEYPIAWTSPIYGTMEKIGFGEGKFVITHAGGLVLTSVDGAFWEPHSLPNDQILDAIGYASGHFMAATTISPQVSPGIYSSTNGILWARHVPRASVFNMDGIRSFAFGQDAFVAVGDAGLIAQSDPLSNTPPAILRNPSNVTVLADGFSVSSLTTVVVGSSPLSYQWFRNGVQLSSNAGASLTLSNLQVWEMGDYQLRVTNDYGAVTSSVAHVSVQTLQPMVHLTSGPNTKLEILGRLGITYIIEGSQSIGGPWPVLHLFAPTQLPYIWIDPESGTIPHRFYRVRELVALPPSVAPAGFGGRRLSVTVNDGSAPFSNTGTYALTTGGFLNNTSATYTITGDGSAIGDSSGTYLYNRTGTNLATLVLQDSSFGTVTSKLTFDAPNSGAITINDDSEGFQTGGFTLE